MLVRCQRYQGVIKYFKLPKKSFVPSFPWIRTFQDPNATEQAALKIQTAYKAMKQRKERERMGKMNGNNTSVISM